MCFTCFTYASLTLYTKSDSGSCQSKLWRCLMGCWFGFHCSMVTFHVLTTINRRNWGGHGGFVVDSVESSVLMESGVHQCTQPSQPTREGRRMHRPFSTSISRGRLRIASLVSWSSGKIPETVEHDNQVVAGSSYRSSPARNPFFSFLLIYAFNCIMTVKHIAPVPIKRTRKHSFRVDRWQIELRHSP